MGRQSRLRQERRQQQAAAWAARETYTYWRGLRRGALVGAFIAALALLVGSARIGFALAAGQRIQFDELHVLFYYVGAFVVGGAVVGLLWPLRRAQFGNLGVALAGVTMGMLLLLRGIHGPYAQWGGREWLMLLLLSPVFGLILAHLLKDEPHA